MDKLKIITAMYTFKKGGSYERFNLMIEAFIERKCEVHCLSLNPIQIKHPFYHNHRTSLPFKIKNGLASKLMVLFFFPLHLLLLGWQEKVDLFVAFGSLYALILAIPKWILKKPMITLIRADSSFNLKTQNPIRNISHINKLYEFFSILFSDRVITNNTAIQERINRTTRKWKKIEAEILFNNIPQMSQLIEEDNVRIRIQLGIPERAKALVTVGVLNYGKNIEILLKCLPKVRISDLYLLIAGDGSTKADLHYHQYLRRLTERMNLKKRVIFTGWLEKEELWRILHTSDLFILPSKSEGMPNAMLEALGFNLPCIGSNIPGIRDILQYDELMFDPLDEETIADKIQQIFLDKQCLEKVRNLCQQRKKVFIFDWKERLFQIATKGISSAAIN